MGEIIHLRICDTCRSPIGTVRAVMALKTCPECYAPVIPVEDWTSSITVAKQERNSTA